MSETNDSDRNRDTGKPAAGEIETLAEGRHLTLRKRKNWEYVERNKAKGVVAVVAITDDKKLILVEQKRPPVDRHVIELPAGLAGDIPYQEDEPLAAAAARELFEETGYRAAEMRLLGSGPSSAGMSNEVITFFHARGLTKTGEGGGDWSESIRVHYVDTREVRDWCKDRAAEGKMIDFKIYAGLYMVSHESHKAQPRLWY